MAMPRIVPCTVRIRRREDVSAVLVNGQMLAPDDWGVLVQREDHGPQLNGAVVITDPDTKPQDDVKIQYAVCNVVDGRYPVRAARFVDDFEAAGAVGKWFGAMVPGNIDQARGIEVTEQRCEQHGGGIRAIWNNGLPIALAAFLRKDANYTLVVTVDMRPPTDAPA